MKLHWKRMIYYLSFLILAIGICGFLWKQGNFTGQDGTSKELYFNTQSIELIHITADETTLVTQADPQLVLRNLNCYIDEILLEGIEWQEEVQVFFSDGTEGFTEENSVFLQPVAGVKGSSLFLKQSAGAIRIDLTELPEQSFQLTGITINPNGEVTVPWKLFLFGILIAELAAVCLSILTSLIPQRSAYWQTLKKYHYFLEDLVIKDIKLKYRRSVIGIVWSILSPLLMMVVITAVFQHIFRFSVDNFAVYYLTGWLIFNFVTEATTGAMTSILNSGALIRKVYIPKYIFPLQKCLFAFVNLLFSLVALVIVMLVLQVRVTWRILLIPIPLFYAFLFSVGIGLILASVTVFFRDVTHLYTVFTMAWMYLTPVIYPIDALPGQMQKLLAFNPMYYYVEYFRKLVLYGELPGLQENLISIFCAVVSLLLGIAVFKKKQDRFILFI